MRFQDMLYLYSNALLHIELFRLEVWMEHGLSSSYPMRYIFHLNLRDDCWDSIRYLLSSWLFCWLLIHIHVIEWRCAFGELVYYCYVCVCAPFWPSLYCCCWCTFSVMLFADCCPSFYFLCNVVLLYINEWFCLMCF